MSKHTPGPWTLRYPGPDVLGPTGDLVVSLVVEHEHPEDMAKADAGLIAAAPDLLDFLKLTLLVAKGAEMLLTGEALGPRRLGEQDQSILTQAEALIAKAEGRP